MELIKSKNQYILLCCIFLFNFCFKLIHISSPALWYDEIISAQDTLLDFGHIKHESEWDKNPPFYYYVLWIWCKLFGISELALRSMSAFFSSFTAVLIYLFANKITSKVNALLIMIIFSLHPFLFYFAQEARCFSLLIFLTTINLMFLYSLLQKPTLFKAFILGVLNFLIFYTHYLAGLILFCQFIYLGILFRKQWIYLALIYITPILLVLLRFTKKQYKVLFLSQEMSKEKNNVPLAHLKYLTDGLTELYVSYFIAILFFIFSVIFLIRTIKKGTLDIHDHFKIFIVFSPLVCVLTLYFLGMLTNVFHERYLIYIIPYLMLSLFIFSENKILFYFFSAGLIFLEVKSIKFGESKRMDYKFCAVLAKEIQKKENVNILIQTHDVVNVFTYYYNQDLFKANWQNMDKKSLANSHIYYIDNLEELKNMSFDEQSPVLFFQSYQKSQDEKLIVQYLKEKGYFKFTTNQIEGVKFSYLKK